MFWRGLLRLLSSPELAVLGLFQLTALSRRGALWMEPLPRGRLRSPLWLRPRHVLGSGSGSDSGAVPDNAFRACDSSSRTLPGQLVAPFCHAELCFCEPEYQIISSSAFLFIPRLATFLIQVCRRELLIFSHVLWTHWLSPYNSFLYVHLPFMLAFHYKKKEDIFYVCTFLLCCFFSLYICIFCRFFPVVSKLVGAM